nr:Brix-domain-containing protein [Cryptomonas curvata]
MLLTQILISYNSVKSKKFLTFIKEFCFVISSYSVCSFTKSLQKIILKYPKLCLDLGFSHLIIFSSYKNKNFLKVSKTPQGPAVIFLIIKYAIKNEICAALNFKPRFNSPVLLLNNFNSNKKNLQMVSTIIRQLFPAKNTDNNLLDKPFEIILFDFNILCNKIEVRIYSVQGISKLIPRYLRKNNKKESVDCNLSFKNSLTSTKKKNCEKNNKNAAFIRIMEVGPRLTLKTIDLFGL